MILGIILIILAFTWLLYETRFLTVRLPYGSKLYASIIDTLPLIVATSIIITAISKVSGIKTKKKDKAGLLGRFKYLMEYVLINRLIRGDNGE